ncbi:MAG: methylated-DNA--[protein]-cysteine S-methyltransferase [Oscillospiraceae bacterium]|nr:methylated-DNA--[protein]-cysteine S-methyltransferase [Oscillospiraceae bacterium]
MKTYHTYPTPIGPILIASDGVSITAVRRAFDNSDYSAFCVGENQKTALTDKAAGQLQEYFSGKRREFDLPLSPHNSKSTAFQRAVWGALLSVPYGETASYKAIAEKVGSPKASRAVGMANNKNPIWIIIPCHRIIGADGGLVGYGGGLDMKKRLLDLERGVLPCGSNPEIP